MAIELGKALQYVSPPLCIHHLQQEYMSLLSPHTNEALAVQRAVGSRTFRIATYAGGMPAPVPVRVRGKISPRALSIVHDRLAHPRATLQMHRLRCAGAERMREGRLSNRSTYWTWSAGPALRMRSVARRRDSIRGCVDAWPAWFSTRIALGGVGGCGDGGRQRMHARVPACEAAVRRRCAVCICEAASDSAGTRRAPSEAVGRRALALHLRPLAGQECMQHFRHAAPTQAAHHHLCTTTTVLLSRAALPPTVSCPPAWRLSGGSLVLWSCPMSDASRGTPCWKLESPQLQRLRFQKLKTM
ncbi:hypothetical protein BST61_g10746 [Cercospora zeina]